MHSVRIYRPAVTVGLTVVPPRGGECGRHQGTIDQLHRWEIPSGTYRGALFRWRTGEWLRNDSEWYDPSDPGQLRPGRGDRARRAGGNYSIHANQDKS